MAFLNAVGNGRVRDRLVGGALLTAEQVATVFESAKYTKALPSNLQHIVRNKFLLRFVVASVLTNFITWQRRNVRVP